MNFTQQQIDALIEGVYNGSITTRDLPVSLYNAISEKLLSALGSVEGSASKSLLNQLKENIYMFSGAKVYQQIQDISLLGDNENIKSFANFRDEALAIYDQYNKNWLETEYSTAIGQAQSATRWEQIEDQKKELPYLQYSAVIDKNTSDICKPLDGICLPVGDKFWNTNTPLNHFNCRCTVIQFDKTDATQAGITSKEDADKATAEISKLRQPLFEGNSGKDRLIYNKEHPYFDVPKADREFAKENFGLPIPQLESIFTPAKTIQEAEQRIIDFDIKLNAKSMKLEHLNKTLEAIETVPLQARPTAVYDRSGYEKTLGRKIQRESSEFQGMALKASVFDKKAFDYVEEKILVINSREFKTPNAISLKKIKYNEFYSKAKDGNKWYLNTFDGSTHFHELGHLYDVNISTKPEWINITNKWHAETKADLIKISKGGDFRGENGSEAFAEAFASYFGNNKKDLPDYVIEYFNKNIK